MEGSRPTYREGMKLAFLYQPVPDLDAAAEYYAKTLRWEEAWRDDASVAFWLPDRSAKVMLSISGKPPGPMYLVDDLDAWLDEHPDPQAEVDRDSAGSGTVIGFWTRAAICSTCSTSPGVTASRQSARTVISR